MIDNKKEQERDELHRTIWNMANDLRGSVDGWDFKQYVLGMLFYRYISENFTKYVNSGEIEAGNTQFDCAKLLDIDAEEAREDLIQSKGYFILPSELFCNVKENAQNNENLNETLEKAFRNIETSAQGYDSEGALKGLFDDIDVNSNKLGGTVAKRNEKLVKLLNSVADMKLGDYQDNTIDAFGDTYEFLMGMYASNAGKSGGEYLSWLATSGVAAIVCFPGVMYRGGAEQKIRKYLIDNNYIECVIQFPDNLFFGTSIATCIMVLKKSKTENTTLFIDASKECVKITNNNKLTEQNIQNILNAYKERVNKEYYAQVVQNEKIAENSYNLSVSSYVEQEDTREKIDIKKLNVQIKEIVAREEVLRTEIDKIIAEIEVEQ